RAAGGGWRRATREHVRPLGDAVGPYREHLGALDQIALPDLVERVGLAVMGLGVFGRILNAKEAGHTNIIEGNVVRAPSAAQAKLREAPIAQRSQDAVQHFTVLVIALQTDAQHAPRAGVMYQDR